MFRTAATLILALCLAGCALQDSKKDLLIQRAGSAAIVQNPEQPHLYILTFKQVDDQLDFLSNQPAKKAGKIGIEEFLGQWTSGAIGPEEQPQASLVFDQVDKQSDDVETNTLRILKQPYYNARSRTMSYEVEQTDGQPLAPGTILNPVLFIEGAYHPGGTAPQQPGD